MKNVTPTPQEDYVNTLYFNNSLYLISALYTKDAGKNILTATSPFPRYIHLTGQVKLIILVENRRNPKLLMIIFWVHLLGMGMAV